ncbi:hypothetical protein AB0D12_20740 [Streptomyces sp. NPDC048479]|uniref:hypothetical protein n=1 Tax=Streptomyces sp. NPDC048479 TaxID=3154725 RepID=UPI00341E4EAB
MTNSSEPRQEPSPEPAPEGSAAGGRPQGSAAGGSAAARIARKVSSAVLIVLTCILVPVSVVTVWVHDIVLDTDRYVATVAPLASNPAIQDAAVNRAVQAVDVRFDAKEFTTNVADWLQSQGLPPLAAQAVKSFAPQVASAVNEAVEKVARRFVESDRFKKVWTTANRIGHNAVDHALTGKGRGAVGVDEGTVTLNVGTAVETIKKDLVDAGLKPASKIPTVNKQLVLFKSDELAKVQNAARALDVIGNWMPIITVLLGAAGVLLAHHRRRALAKTALGAALACLIFVIALVVGRSYYLSHLPPQVLSHAAAGAVYDTLLHFLRITLRTVIVLGVIIAVGAYLIGPGRLPRAVRGTADRTADSVAGWGYSHGVHTGEVGTWTESHRRWINVGLLLVLALIFALWNHPTALTVLLLVLILLAALAVTSLLAATGRRTQAPKDTGTRSG